MVGQKVTIFLERKSLIPLVRSDTCKISWISLSFFPLLKQYYLNTSVSGIVVLVLFTTFQARIMRYTTDNSVFFLLPKNIAGLKKD